MIYVKLEQYDRARGLMEWWRIQNWSFDVRMVTIMKCMETRDRDGLNVVINSDKFKELKE
jgi:hypothetical protein